MGVEHITVPQGKFLWKPFGYAGGHKDLGEVSDFDFTAEVNDIEVMSSRGGQKVMLKRPVTQQKATINLVADELSPFNVSLFSMADDPISVAQSAGTIPPASEQDIVCKELDEWVPIGKYDISNLIVNNAALDKVYKEGIDYEVELKHGMIRPLTGGEITADDTIKISYVHAAVTSHIVKAATKTIVKGDLLFLGDPVDGIIHRISGRLQLKPGGAVGQIKEEVSKLTFSGEFLKVAGVPGLYNWEQIGFKDTVA